LRFFRALVITAALSSAMEINSFLGLRKRRSKQRSTVGGSPGSGREIFRFDHRRVRREPSGGIPGLHGPEQIYRILVRERADSDRAGTTLSLLALAVSDKGPTEDLSQLASVLSWRLSRTGTAGFLGMNRIGVILPDTSITAAHRVARDVLAAIGEQIERELAYAVFIYPSHEYPAQDHADDETGLKEPLQAYPLEPFFATPAPRWKRLIDIMGAAAGIVLLSPLLLAVSLAIRVSSPGPVFFLQDREGIGGRRFTIFKFRTMYSDAELRKAHLYEMNEQDGPAFKIRKDPRVTPLGRILRRTCLDELPQLWNVLKGDMSLVGPRPLPWDESRACSRWQRRRLDVTPGLTCIWQVRGGLDVSFDEWMRMDIEYAENHTLWKDVKLILHTVWRMLLMRASH
jgi:lipopolysaccharide/colanic/teichoic acid biosynthesis glycosyltransferase